MVAIHQLHCVDALANGFCSCAVQKEVIDLVLGVGGGVSPGTLERVACVRGRGIQLVSCQKPTQLKTSRVEAGITVNATHIVIRSGVVADGGIPIAPHDEDLRVLTHGEDALHLVQCMLANRCQVSGGGCVVNDSEERRPSESKPKSRRTTAQRNYFGRRGKNWTR
jgi:hypothetical protein